MSYDWKGDHAARRHEFRLVLAVAVIAGVMFATLPLIL